MNSNKLAGIGILVLGIWFSWAPIWGLLQYVLDVAAPPEMWVDSPYLSPIVLPGVVLGIIVIIIGVKLVRKEPCT